MSRSLLEIIKSGLHQRGDLFLSTEFMSFKDKNRYSGQETEVAKQASGLL